MSDERGSSLPPQPPRKVGHTILSSHISPLSTEPGQEALSPYWYQAHSGGTSVTVSHYSQPIVGQVPENRIKVWDESFENTTVLRTVDKDTEDED